jgi:hypothetical protein
MSIVLGAIVVLIGVPTYFLFYHAPICTDGKMNGDETGVDCGGSCQKICTPDSLPIISEGDAQILTVASSTYEVVALFKNPNPAAEIYRARYSIKLYDATRVSPIKIIEGDTYVAKNSSFAIFQGPFNISDTVPTRAVFEWNTDTLVWKKSAATTADISVSDNLLSGEDSLPRLEAVAHNDSLLDAANIEFIAILSDADGNAVAASKTYLETLAKGVSASILFSWPQPFASKVSSVNIIPRIYPDASFFK